MQPSAPPSARFPYPPGARPGIRDTQGMDVLTEILYPAVEEAKGLLETDKLQPTPDSPLFGDGGLDSMGLVRFIVLVEERIEDATDVALTLASDKAMSRRSSPFATLGSLAEYIQECLTEEGYGG